MQLLNKKTHIDFLSLRKLALVLSVVLMLISIAALATRSLNFGIDFTGGTLVEVGYSDAVEVDTVRKALDEAAKHELGEAIIHEYMHAHRPRFLPTLASPATAPASLRT